MNLELRKTNLPATEVKSEVSRHEAYAALMKSAFKGGNVTYDEAFKAIANYLLTQVQQIGGGYSKLDSEKGGDRRSTATGVVVDTNKQNFIKEVNTGKTRVADIAFMYDNNFSEEYIQTVYSEEGDTFPTFSGMLDHCKSSKIKCENLEIVENYDPTVWEIFDREFAIGIANKKNDFKKVVAAIDAYIQQFDTLEEKYHETFISEINATKKRTIDAILFAAANAVQIVDKKEIELIDIIYCDPPWEYDFSSTKSREIENHYPTMSIEELYEMQLPETNENCLIYMWSTAPKLLEAIKLLGAWGFEYKTHAIWDKEKIGMGYWFRGQHELLLVATKGKFSPPDQDKRVSSVLREKRGKHSRKPELVYKLIENSFPDATKIELFARMVRPGWKSWGNDI